MSELAVQRYFSHSEAHLFVPAWGADAPSESWLSLETENYLASLAQSRDEVREVQQLRYQIFSEEYGATFLGPERGARAYLRSNVRCSGDSNNGKQPENYSFK